MPKKKPVKKPVSKKKTKENKLKVIKDIPEKVGKGQLDAKKYKALVDSSKIDKPPVKKGNRGILTKEAQKILDEQEKEMEEMEKQDLYEISIDEGGGKVSPFNPFKDVEYKEKYCEDMVAFFLRVKRKLQLIKTYHKPDHRLDGKDLSMLVTGEMAGPIKSVYPKEKIPMFPTFQRFYTDIGATKKIFYGRIELYPEFKNTWEYCKDLQLAILLEGTMLGFYKDNFTQFLMKNDFEYKDESTVKVQDNREKEELTDEQIEAKLKTLREAKAKAQTEANKKK